MEVNIKKYLGKWYEIARIPNIFEPIMTGVTTEYTLNDDGSIKIINSGYVRGEFKTIEGKGLLTDQNDLLKVTFNGNTYSDYKILAVTSDYSYSLVGGEKSSSGLYNLWILGRTNSIPKDVIDLFYTIAREKGYNPDWLKITQD